jgi:hypothetical protein
MWKTIHTPRFTGSVGSHNVFELEGSEDSRKQGSSDEYPPEDLERLVNWSRDTSKPQLKEGVGNIV